MMKTSILVLVAVILGSTDAQNYSKKAWNFVSVFNGLFTNEPRLSENFTHHSLIKLIATPVNGPPCMGEGPFMFLEVGEDVNKVELREFIRFVDGGENVLYLIPYHYKDWDKDSQGQFDTSKFATYTKDDFWTDPSWKIGMEAIEDGIFFGIWPVLTHKGVNGTRLTWGTLFLCDKSSVSIPAGGDEIRDSVPYYYVREGDKFPLINPPADYVSPCDQKSCPCGKS
ncbi:hypothetical protein BsWGS_23694 [Bradybaena similaris]